MNKPKAPLIPPVKIADNLFWVGVRYMSPSHLLLTSEGLVLIDSGSYDTVDELIANIESLGFDVKDIKHIVHSHGHFDHTGATPRIVALSGAKTYIGLGDESAVRGDDDLLWAGLEVENHKDFYFEPDVIVKDGDVLDFGDVKMRFVSTPGHTVGTMSMFWNVKYRGKEYVAGMFGGAGDNTLTDKYLEAKGLPVTMRNDYVKSVNRLLREHVELHIGNHPGNNRHVDKAARLTDTYNPFIEENTWIPFLEGRKKEVIELYNVPDEG